MVNESDGDQRAYRTIDILRTDAYESLVNYRNEQATYGSVSQETVADMARKALAWRERLLNFKEDPALKRPWEERGVDWIAEAAERTVTVEESLPRSNGNARTVRRSALVEADPEAIAATTQELMQIGRELGFEAPTRKSRPRGRIGKSKSSE